MRGFRFLFVCLTLVMFAQNALAQSVYSLQEEVDELREDIKNLQRKNYNEDTEGNIVPKTPADTVVMVGELDEAVRKLNGRADMMDHKIKQLEDKIDLINKDVDMRIKALEGKQQAATGEVKTVPMPATYPVSEAESAPKALTGESVKTGDVGPIENENAKKIYDKGLEDLKAGKHGDSEKAFQEVLTKYPNDNLAGNAQYWLGEVYYVKKDYEKAAVAFAKGYQNYKSGAKGPDSLLKLGMTMLALKKNDEACAAFTSLDKEFPKASKELKDKAKAESGKLKCK